MHSSWAAIEPICKWYGIAPFCFIGNSCPDGCSLAATSDRGDGALCWISQKHYCCCVKRTVDSIINTIIPSK
jgi:hypothetical protein